jgi:hypothetical protein
VWKVCDPHSPLRWISCAFSCTWRRISGVICEWWMWCTLESHSACERRDLEGVAEVLGLGSDSEVVGTSPPPSALMTGSSVCKREADVEG